jgi:hypothetical protein
MHEHFAGLILDYGDVIIPEHEHYLEKQWHMLAGELSRRDHEVDEKNETDLS